MHNHRVSAVILPFVLAGSLSAAVQAPVLKWARGGCSSWCETGWYSSPAIADLNHDGLPEVVAAAYTVRILKGLDGSSVGSFNNGGGRVWSGVVVADINGDSSPEIVVSSEGKVMARNASGDSLWTRVTGANECRGVAAADLNGAGRMQIVVNGHGLDSLNTWIYAHDGSAWPGWPQRSGTAGYSWGVYNDNVAIGNLQGGAEAEIVVPSDVHYICAYRSNGTALPASTLFGSKTWGQVGVWADTAPENRGWGDCGGSQAESFRANFATGAAVIADVDNDGTPEVVVTGNVYDCSDADYASKYTGLFIFNADRTRFKRGAYDWTLPPAGSGAPLVEDYSVIESCMPDPVVADIDGDNAKELLFSSYDGKVHAFHLDRTEHDNWPFSVYNSVDGYFQFASPPVVADLDNDGKAEVLFTTWTAKGSNKTGSLYILDYRGNVLQQVALPDTAGGRDWNGGLASPTIDKIDTSGNYGIVIVSATGGVVAYNLPGTQNARILWGTGRGNYRRDGNVLSAASPAVERPGSLALAPHGPAGSLLLNFGDASVRITVPFAVDKGYRIGVFDIRGRSIPCRPAGAVVSVSARSAGLLIVRVKAADGRDTFAAKIVR